MSEEEKDKSDRIHFDKLKADVHHINGIEYVTLQDFINLTIEYEAAKYTLQSVAEGIAESCLVISKLAEETARISVGESNHVKKQHENALKNVRIMRRIRGGKNDTH